MTFIVGGLAPYRRGLENLIPTALYRFLVTEIKLNHEEIGSHMGFTRVAERLKRPQMLPLFSARDGIEYDDKGAIDFMIPSVVPHHPI